MSAPRNDPRRSWLALLCRVLVGGTFLVSGTLKLIAPVENFQEAVRAFHLVPEGMVVPVALVLPWVELFVGAFCLFGLYTRWSAWMIAVFLVAFIGGFASAMARGLTLENCGCFAQWDFLHEPSHLLIRDAVLLLLTLPLLRKQRFRFSLEDYSRARGDG